MILDEIVLHKRGEVARRRARIPEAEYRRRAESTPEPRDFAGALRTEDVSLVAEIKGASPSQGELRPEVDVVRTAALYEANGAAAVSVLTDRKYFRGEPNNLKAARVGTRLPVLRKDFIVEEYQVYESRALQADAILLIVRILDDAQLREYRLAAEGLGMAALVEVHEEGELERALAAGARLVGINNRDLGDFSVDLGTTERLARLVPPEVTLVSESGIGTRAEVERAAAAGVEGVLVGSALMRAEDIGAKARELTGVPRLRRGKVR